MFLHLILLAAILPSYLYPSIHSLASFCASVNLKHIPVSEVAVCSSKWIDQSAIIHTSPYSSFISIRLWLINQKIKNKNSSKNHKWQCHPQNIFKIGLGIVGQPTIRQKSERNAFLRRPNQIPKHSPQQIQN